MERKMAIVAPSKVRVLSVELNELIGQKSDLESALHEIGKAIKQKRKELNIALQKGKAKNDYLPE